MSADEFVVLCDHVSTVDGTALVLADRLRALFALPFTLAHGGDPLITPDHRSVARRVPRRPG